MNVLSLAALVLFLGGAFSSQEMWKEFARSALVKSEPTDVTVEGLAEWNAARPHYVRVTDYSIYRQTLQMTVGSSKTVFLGLCPEDGEETVAAMISMSELEYEKWESGFEFPPLVGVMQPPNHYDALGALMKEHWPDADPDKIWRLNLNAQPWTTQQALIGLIAAVAAFAIGTVLLALFIPPLREWLAFIVACVVVPRSAAFLPLPLLLGATPERWRMWVGAGSASLGMGLTFGAVMVSRPLERLATLDAWSQLWRIAVLDVGVALLVAGLVFVLAAPQASPAGEMSDALDPLATVPAGAPEGAYPPGNQQPSALPPAFSGRAGRV
ncbi:MAG TPA: hypothetical protein VGE52_15875 [Pirellulales bacterium]